MRLLVSSTPKIMPSLLPDYSRFLGTLVTPSNGGAFAQARRLWNSHAMPWAADNECFKGLDAANYRAMLARITGAPGCLWVTVPDVVGDARATLALFRAWRDEVAACGHPLALVGQDGLTPADVPWGEVGAVFIGGSTAWKLSGAASALAEAALSRGKAVHMGRVNSYRRYRIAFDMGCQTVDGTRCCRFADEWLPTSARFLRGLDSEASLFGAA